MLRRPKPGEGEADLLSLQEQFLTRGEPPAAPLAGGKRKGSAGEGNVGRLGGKSICYIVGGGHVTTYLGPLNSDQGSNLLNILTNKNQF